MACSERAGDRPVRMSEDKKPPEAEAAHDADLVFVSPVFATASHPHGEVLGLDGAMALARRAGMPAVALGGMDRKRGDAAMAVGFHGWAGIGAFLPS